MMRQIIANIVRGRTLSYLLAAGLTFAAAQSAQAADRNWKGGGSDTLWSTAGNWKDNATAPGSSDTAKFVASDVGGSFSGKTVTLRDTYTVKLLHMSGGSDAVNPIVFNADQNSSHGLTVNEDVWLGYYADGGLWIKSGTYTFGVNSDKGLKIGGDSSHTHNFWLKVGDGSSTVSVTAKKADTTIRGASQFIADKATLDFTGKKFLTYDSSGAYITNSTMTANRIVLEGSSSMTAASGSTITATGDHSNFTETSQFIADNATLDFTGKNFNMYGTSSANIKDSETTAAILNVAVNEGDNCKAVFNGGSLTLSLNSAIGYGKNTTGRLIATNLTFETSEVLKLGGADNNNNFTGAKGYVEKTGGDWILRRPLNIAMSGSSTGVFTNYSGTVDVRDDVYVGRSGGTGTLAIEGGTVTVISTKAVNLGWSGGHGWLYLDGGVLVCKNVRHYNDGHVVFNGGTLKANAVGENGLLESSLAVTVGANGGTIDNDNKAITVAAPIGGTGAMTFAGGGSVTLSASATYTGVTTVSNSTTLALGSGVSLAGDLSLLPGATLSSSSGFTLAEGRTVGVAASGTANFNSNLVLGSDATLGFNFTEKSIAPVLAIESGKTASGTVKVKVSAAGGIRPKGGTYTLSSGGGFTGVNVSVDKNDNPKWVDGIIVNGDGNIVLTVKPAGLMFLAM